MGGRAAEDFDAIVIGAGEAGSVVASLAVEAGHRVAMIYRGEYGSTCLNSGCVPSKFLIHRARVAHVVRTAARFHVRAAEPSVDLAAIVEEKDAMVAEHRASSLEGALAAADLALVHGEARFLSPREVAVGGRVLRAPRVFIATGLRPAIPAIDGLERVPYLTNETLMALRALPEHLLVLGGGYVACELAQAYARFGARVTIVQRRSALVADEEPDVGLVLERAFAAEGIAVLLDHHAVSIEPSGSGVRATLRPGDGEDTAVEASHLLVATGRRPNTDTLDLAAAGVRADAKGYVAVNDRMETNVPGIWAVGDVNGAQPFTRVCQEEAKIAYVNAFEGAGEAIDRLPLGHAIFTDPEIGSVGLTEEQARAAGHRVAVGLVTFDQVEKAELTGETTGFIKYVIDRETRLLLGCHVIGPQAADLVYDAALVLRRRGTLDEIAKTVGIFPTLQEGMEGTARSVVRRHAPAAVAGPLAVRSLSREREPAKEVSHG